MRALHTQLHASCVDQLLPAPSWGYPASHPSDNVRHAELHIFCMD